MSETKPKPFVFVLMPLAEEFAEIYKLGIKEACESAGAYCERVDEQMFDENILDRIYNQIAKADIIVADMTGRNANVFYETGYAHALNKQVILLTQNVKDIPFDLTHYSHVVYDGKIIPLRQQLQARVRWCVENPREPLSSVDFNLQVFVNNMPLEQKPVITVHAAESVYYRAFSLNINVHNAGNTVIEPDCFHLALVGPTQLEFDATGRTASQIQLSDDKQILNLKITERLFPDGWNAIYLSCRIATKNLSFLRTEEPVDVILRLFTEVGPKDLPFSLKLTFQAIEK